MSDTELYYLLSIINGYASMVLSVVCLGFILSDHIWPGTFLFVVSLAPGYGCYHFYFKAQG